MGDMAVKEKVEQAAEKLKQERTQQLEQLDATVEDILKKQLEEKEKKRNSKRLQSQLKKLDAEKAKEDKVAKKKKKKGSSRKSSPSKKDKSPSKQAKSPRKKSRSQSRKDSPSQKGKRKRKRKAEKSRGGRRKKKVRRRCVRRKRSGGSRSKDSSRSDSRSSRSSRREKRNKRERSSSRGRRRDRGGSSRAGAKDSELEAFRDKYPMDDRAFDLLSNGVSGEVQKTVLGRFKPRSEGDDDYSALVQTFVRAIQGRLDNGRDIRDRPPPRELRRARSRSKSKGGPRSDSPLSVFRDRYPMDERAFAALEQSQPSVRDVVIADFKPRREGESDYSALVMAFVRAVQSRVGSGRTRERSRDRSRDRE